MICEHCGNPVPEGMLTCPLCGTYLPKRRAARTGSGGAADIRQGRMSSETITLPPRETQKREREYGDYDLSAMPMDAPRAAVRGGSAQKGRSFPDTRRGLPVKPQLQRDPRPAKPVKPHGMRHRSFNWMLFSVIALAVVLGAGIFVYSYSKNSDEGHLKTARKNVLACNEGMLELAVNSRDILVQAERTELLKNWQESPAQSYWEAGQDFAAVGDMGTAITAYRIADILDPENYDGLMLLATAYQMNVQDAEAEQVYLRLTEEVGPSRSDAYTSLINMYLDQLREPEAADLMQLAYERTDRDPFRTQRKALIPQEPQTSLNAGRYDISRFTEKVYLSSPEGYDIYYTLDDDAVLPEEGVLSTEGAFVPEEGTVKLRAVCVCGNLKSDELSVSYTFYYPTPPAPKCNLGPNTYKKLQTVSLRAGTINDDTMTRKEKAEEEKYYTYYYTIDGTMPDPKVSPIYDGTPIKLPAGRVTLRAICVNRYGKSSSVLEVGYKFTVTPYLPDVYLETDTFEGFVLNKTTQDEFTSRFGKPNRTLETVYISQEWQARHLEYDWGYAVFMLDNARWKLVRIQMDSRLTNGPRNVGFGSSEQDVCAAFKDFGMPENQDSSRNLYYDYPCIGRVLVQEDGTRVVQYTLENVSSETWVLQYWLKNGRVNRIVNYYQP